MRKMILNHQSAVDLFKTEDQYGEEESVVSFARETLDTLREHLTEARSIYDALNNSSSNSSTSDSSSSSSSRGSSSNKS
jgi:putative membrane protein